MKKVVATILIGLNFVLTGCYARIGPARAPLILTAESKHPHPYFDDKETLSWFKDNEWNKMLEQQKMVLVVLSRKECGMCKTFVETIIPQYQKALLKWLGSAADIDNPDTKANELREKYVKDAKLLPIVMVLNEKGEFLRSLWGTDISDTEKVDKLIYGR